MSLQTLHQPLINIQIDRRPPTYDPGDVLSGSFQIDAIDPIKVRAVEVAILWFTEGTGEEDVGVHHFQRITFDEAVDQNLQDLQSFQSILPNSPLSYEGVSVKVCWCVRVRAFVENGRDHVSERAFQLGHVPLARSVAEESR